MVFHFSGSGVDLRVLGLVFWVLWVFTSLMRCSFWSAVGFWLGGGCCRWSCVDFGSGWVWLGLVVVVFLFWFGSGLMGEWFMWLFGCFLVVAWLGFTGFDWLPWVCFGVILVLRIWLVACLVLAGLLDLLSGFGFVIGWLGLLLLVAGCVLGVPLWFVRYLRFGNMLAVFGVVFSLDG